VAHAWNYLHEKLGQLFVVISGADRDIALAIWYSTDSDRTQRSILKAAIAASVDRRNELPKASEDLKWLLDRADEVAEQRNNAIHAPCSLYVGGGEDSSTEMGASFIYGHPRARKLMGKTVLIEFDWCERYAETLTRFTLKLETAIAFADQYPWPDRPSLPHRKTKK